MRRLVVQHMLLDGPSHEPINHTVKAWVA